MLIYTETEPSDLSTLIKLYDDYLNSGSPIDGYLEKGLLAEGYVGVKCVDDETGKLVGILSARPGIQFTCGHPELIKLIGDRWGTEGAYTGDMLVVLPDYRGQGVARRLAFELRRGLMRKHAKYVVLEQWLRYIEKDVPALGPMQYTGKPTLVKVDREFYKDLDKFGLECPQCGKHCKCGAVVSIVEFEYPEESDEKN